MADEKKIVSWSELENVEDVFSKTVLLPGLTERLGKEVHCKVRAIEALEIVKAFNFPLAEVNELVAENAEPDAFGKAIQEHTKTFSAEQMLDTMQAVIKTGLVEPDPSEGNLRKLSSDFETIFLAIVGLTVPKGAVAEAAQFREDGERGSG